MTYPIWTDSYPMVAIGRPFTVEGSSRTTTSESLILGHSNDANSWNIQPKISIMENSSYNHEIGVQWLQQAEGEHASVARHTLQLMSIGAPSDLLLASQAASIDEIK